MSDDFARELKKLTGMSGQITDSEKLTVIVGQLHCLLEQLSRMRKEFRDLLSKAETKGGE